MWKASAPSNIALIKYMGKATQGVNQAVNPSLSMTLSDFRTEVELEEIAGTEDRWRPLPGSAPLRAESTGKFMRFFQRLKAETGVQAAFEVRSGNNFPSDAGLASSASSFAALTRAAFACFADRKILKSDLELARISREGSGSSCRSFFSPWCAWEGNEIYVVPAKLPPLLDLVTVTDSGYKKVSSSEAHRRVETSPLFAGRAARAAARLSRAKEALGSGDFRALAEVSWEDMWDMHSLFHTSQPPFFYFAPETVSVLRWVEARWEKTGGGPIATIDAGPNVHLLVPLEEAARYRAELARLPVRVLESRA